MDKLVKITHFEKMEIFADDFLYELMEHFNLEIPEHRAELRTIIDT